MNISAAMYSRSETWREAHGAVAVGQQRLDYSANRRPS